MGGSVFTIMCTKGSEPDVALLFPVQRRKRIPSVSERDDIISVAF